MEQLQQWRDPNGVIHIRFRVMDHTRPGRAEDVHLRIVYVDAVDENRLFACHPQFIQPAHGGHVIPGKRIFTVGRVFSHVDVTTHTCLPGNAYTFLNGRIRQGERGMHTHHRRNLPIPPANLLDKALVFRNPTPGNVAVRNFIAQGCTDARLPDRVLNQVERALPHTRGGMVINDGGRAIADAVDQR